MKEKNPAGIHLRLQAERTNKCINIIHLPLTTKIMIIMIFYKHTKRDRFTTY